MLIQCKYIFCSNLSIYSIKISAQPCNSVVSTPFYSRYFAAICPTLRHTACCLYYRHVNTTAVGNSRINYCLTDIVNNS